MACHDVFSLQVMSVVSIIILTGFELGTLSDLFMLVGIQLAVRHGF
jgi:hypothetical protein